MRLVVIFVATLAISIITSSTATWGLTYSTSYEELRDMSSGFVELSTSAVDDFGQLVWELIGDLGTLVSDTLDEEYRRSIAQLNETGTQFLQSTMDLMERAKASTVESQRLLGTILASFGSFMQSALSDFKAVDTDYASRLRAESASRAQVMFSSRMHERIASIQRQARLYGLGMLDIRRRAEQPLDDGVCSLLGLLCAASAEIQRSAFIGTAAGNMAFCDIEDVAYTRVVHQGATADNITLMAWAPYSASTMGTNFSSWKQSCLAGSNASILNATCPHGTAIEYPACNGTCGYDPRCRPWYTLHDAAASPRTQMSDVYKDVLSGDSVVTLSYPIYSSSLQSLLAVVASDFHFDDVDKFLVAMGSSGYSQLVAVMFNSLDLIVVGTNRACSNATQYGSGVPILQTCHTALQELGVWLLENQGMASNTSLELNGTLWEVFPSTVDSFSYFVVVGMNKSEIFARVTATSQAAQVMLQNLSDQQSALMAETEAATLSDMTNMASQKIAILRTMEAQLEQNMEDAYIQAAKTVNASRHTSAERLSSLTTVEMDSIHKLEDDHLAQVVRNVGPTFAAVIGIFIGILVIGSYGTASVTRQVRQIAQVMEDVAYMRVEGQEVSQKSWIKEVQRIEVSLGILVQRLAEYKSYMPAGLFHSDNLPEEVQAPALPLMTADAQKRLLSSPHLVVTPSCRESSIGSRSSSSLFNTDTVAARIPSVVNSGTRLLRHSVTVMAVNIIHFQAEMAQRPAAVLEATLNRLISTVHSVASKAQGNLDAVVGDQLLVTFNAHFTCSDPPTAASCVALDLIETMKADMAPGSVQIGLASGAVHSGHLGYTQFKSMVSLGAPIKVASLLAHLSDFKQSVVLVCPSVEERIKYHFHLQPADLVALPGLGNYVALYSKSIRVFILEGRKACGQEPQEWLYHVGTDEAPGEWAATFDHIAEAASMEMARSSLNAYLHQHPEDRLAQRLLVRLVHWKPQLGIRLAERPDKL